MLKKRISLLLLMVLVWTNVHAAPADQPKTGQTTSYATGDDGDLEKGVAWPSPRFTDNANGTVTDNLTGLIWLKNANCTATIGGVAKGSGYLAWANALTWSNSLASGACGLSDSSLAGDWRLPNVNELESLVNAGQSNSATWLNTQGFSNVQADYYWSSTTYAYDTPLAWIVVMWDGFVIGGSKTSTSFVWPVRAGQTLDIWPPTTTASPAGGTYPSSQSVTLTPNETATTYYCLGSGCNPTTVGTSVNITESTALRYYSKDTANNSEAIKTDTYTIVIGAGNLANTGGDTATGGTDLFSGVRRIDSIGGSDTGDSDADNLDGGKATIDLAYRFELAVNDTAEPTSVKLYISDRPTPGTFISNPEQWAVYILNPASDCTGSGWTTGKICSKDMKLGPAPGYKFYYEVATISNGMRYLPGGASPAPATGPVVKSLSGWAMLSVPRDITSESVSALFGSGTAYRWVSTALGESPFYGGYQGISTDAKEGESYFVNGTAKVMPYTGSTYSSGSVSIPVREGWNMIGTPFNKELVLNDTSASFSEGGGLWSALVGPNVLNLTYEYDGGDWGGTYNSIQSTYGAKLAPWAGYWIYIGDCPGGGTTCTLVLANP